MVHHANRLAGETCVYSLIATDGAMQAKLDRSFNFKLDLAQTHLEGYKDSKPFGHWTRLNIT